MKLKYLPTTFTLLALTLAPRPASAMEYVKVCDQDHCKQFSRLVMGTDHLIQDNWQRNGEKAINEAELHEILDEAVRLGINFFDTSPIYVGGVEYRLGKWLKARQNTEPNNPDKQLYTLSKGGFPYDLYYTKKLLPGTYSKTFTNLLEYFNLTRREHRPHSETPLLNVPAGSYASRLYGSPRQIKRRLAEELGHTEKNLGQAADVYLMHRDDHDFIGFQTVPRSQTPVQTIMSVLSASEFENNFHMIGWSNWQTPRVTESLALAKKHNTLKTPVINSPYFSLFEMSRRTIHAGGVQVTHKNMMNPDFQKGIHIMPYSPLGGFSILDKREPAWENARAAARAAYEAQDPYWKNVYLAIFTPENEARYHRAVDFTRRFNAKHSTQYTLDQMLNAYVLAHPQVKLLAIGPRNVDQLRRTVESLKLAKMLTPEDLNYLYGNQ